ncbi:MAG: hypothetical protein UW22_C0002G0009 [Candidatus Gottesmanbacteria bacterium GW2011_GWB1_44_11c]|uniref:DUF6680 domain-containing protein n=2 Tax=Candidatus Gottesmaniibacteriota TaxID=1752720 RepID=A0A0G1IQR0_9BACT|nr:MAG: hypothetical protein UW22_C0002G0009 [Candidatus Gottesmanbacteria bacterium GW2011_GWB1_44_11c]KKT61495.1 MAG: hypothetical protein UW52_C0002G0009 [Candidatus Gottesmanbacteria bacterium GW2011_GWA1_44_24b]HCM81892.1 hypothetical protein [Patescibacteria group bacterium]
MNINFSSIISTLVGPLVVGLVIWWVNKNDSDKRVKNEAIRDIMYYRGDYSTPEFRRSLNKVSITFHKDEEIRQQIRKLYEDINNPINTTLTVNRKIVSLIYNLCHKNGFEGITEYDIDQAFPERQTPAPSPLPQESLGKQSKKLVVKNGKKVK